MALIETSREGKMISNSHHHLKVGTVLISMLLVVGCGYRMADFTATATKNLNIPIAKLEKGARVSGEDCAHKFLFFPIGHVVPDVKAATDQALEKDGSNLLLDAVWEYESFSFIFFSSECIKVTGTAVKTD